MNGEAMVRPVGARDRVVVLGGLMAVTALAWAYLLYMGWGMEHMEAGADMAIMPRMTDWKAIDLLLVFAMWVIMMAAMMLPSAAPMLLVFAALNRARRAQREPFAPTGIFALGYLAAWTVFSLLATLAQWGLLEARLVTPMMESASPLLGGALLIAAGVFQFTPLKRTCLAGCSSPLTFVMTEWREGTRGAFIMGLRHGAYCIGCCWLLMALLFVFGVMNLLWIAFLAIFVLVEKLLPGARWLSSAGAVLLIAWGLLVAGGY